MDRNTLVSLVNILSQVLAENRELRKNEKEHVGIIFSQRKWPDTFTVPGHGEVHVSALQGVLDQQAQKGGDDDQVEQQRLLVEDLKRSLTDVRSARDTALVQVEHLEGKVDALRRDVSGFEEQVARLKEDRDDWKERAKGAIDEAVERKVTIDRLEAQLRANHPEYAESEAGRMAAQLVLANVGNDLDDAGIGQGPLLERLRDLVQERDKWKEKARNPKGYQRPGYADTAGPDRETQGVRK